MRLQRRKLAITQENVERNSDVNNPQRAADRVPVLHTLPLSTDEGAQKFPRPLGPIGLPRDTRQNTSEIFPEN